jgi:hypothetical protein
MLDRLPWKSRRFAQLIDGRRLQIPCGAQAVSGDASNSINPNSNPHRRNYGKQSKRGLDWFTEGRQRHNFHGNRRSEGRKLLLRYSF